MKTIKPTKITFALKCQRFTAQQSNSLRECASYKPLRFKTELSEPLLRAILQRDQLLNFISFGEAEIIN